MGGKLLQNASLLKVGRILAASIAVSVVAFETGAYVAEQPVTSDTNGHRQAAQAITSTGAAFGFADLVKQVAPAVVMVVTDRDTPTKESENFDNLPPEFRDFLNPFGNRGQQPRSFRQRAMGSGFVIDPAGYLVTNNHVVDGAKKISVRLTDGRDFPAKLVGADPTTDVALLKIDAPRSLSSVSFGDDRKLQVGDWVVAVGNPFGLGGTVTAGIVSSIGRDIGDGPYRDYIQIDASINRGNSGGPTFDLSGHVVGMNTAIFSPSGGSIGIGFAIPASTIQSTVEQLKTHGSVTRGWLGVEIQNLTPELASSLGVPDAKGALVANVVESSPAEAAGFRTGDIVTRLEDSVIETSRDLSRRVADLHVGDKVRFTVLRDGTPRVLNVTIAKRDEQRLASRNGPIPQTSPSAASALGMRFSPLTSEMRERYGIARNVDGVLVTAVDPASEAAQQGLSEGDLIVSVTNTPVHAPADIVAKVREAGRTGRETVLLLVESQQGRRFVALKTGKT